MSNLDFCWSFFEFVAQLSRLLLFVCSLVQEVLELQVHLARLNAKLDEAENARRVLDTARRDLEKEINIKVA